MSCKQIDYATRLQMQPIVPSVGIDASTLTTIMKAVSVVVEEEATFTINSGGLSFYGMDKSHVSLLELQMSSIGLDEEVKFAVKPKEVLDKLREMKVKNTRLTIELGDRINISGGGLKFEVKRYETMNGGMPRPKVDFTSKLVLIDEVVKGIRDLGEVVEYLTFSTQKDVSNFKLESRGDWIKRFEAELFAADGSEIRENTKATYSSEYLNAFLPVYLRATDRKDIDLTMEFGTKLPVKMTFNIEHLKVTFWLAPRVQD